MKLITKNDPVTVRYATDEIAQEQGLADKGDLDVIECHAAVAMFVAGMVDRITVPNEELDVYAHFDGEVSVSGWEGEKFPAQMWKLQAEAIKLMVVHNTF